MDEQNSDKKEEKVSENSPDNVQLPVQQLRQNIIVRPIDQEMKGSYIDYAMSVIVGRALPDIRDGLKPVHRRILYAMNDLGIVHNKPFKKSARIVGECFVKDTLLATTKGLLPIQDIQECDIVYTQKGENKVTEIYEMPEKELLKVTLSNGISNTVTLSQKFKVINKDLQFIWKEAKDLQEEDYIVVRSVYPSIKEYVLLGEFNGKNIYLNENIAYLLGQLLSDGWVEKGYNRGKGFRCGFCSNSIEVINKIALILQQEFAYEATIEYKEKEILTAAGDLVLSKLQTVRINTTLINEFLVNVFSLQQATAFTKIIPQQMFKSPSSVIFSLISGMIDGDGSVHKNRNAIHYGSISEKMIDQLQLLLQTHGIFNTKYTDEKLKKGGLINGRMVESRKTFYSLEIDGRFARALAQRLSLAHEKKIENIQFQKKNLLKVSSYDEIPYAGEIIFNELAKKHLGGGWYQNSHGKKFRMGIKYSTGTKIRYSKNLKEKALGKTQIISWGIREKLQLLQSSLTPFINQIINNNISFLRVQKMEKVAAEKTYDIQVENEHEFIANGVVSHNCLGKYHPHGDTAVYDSLVRMAQDFSLRYRLIDGQGNFGSVDGDNAASMRYTEARTKKIAEEMLEDLEKETVLFADNFDGSLKEPSVLPSKVPNLLINGSSGIAVGMATNIPPHNLTETCTAIIKTLENPDISVQELLLIMHGPDFPTGGIICGRNGIVEYFSTGRGKVLVRGKTHIEKKHERESIIITEIPYMTNKALMIESLAEHIKNKVIEGISDIRDESDRDGMRVVIELKRDAISDVVLNNLYKHTNLQTTFGIILLALVNNEPKILPLKNMITEFIKHRKHVVVKRTEFDLRKAEERAHILEGLIIALNNIDKAVALIKASKSVELARQGLMSNFTLSEIQANAILEMKLQRLTSLEQDKIREEHKGLMVLIADLKDILAKNVRVIDIIIAELRKLIEDYGDTRKTEISETDEQLDVEDLIPQESVAITITHAGYIKRLPVATYKAQRRGGKGIVATTTKDEDFVEDLFVANTHDYILFFTNTGKVHWLKVYKIPEASRIAKGKAIVNLLQLPDNEKITAFIPISQFDDKHYLLMVTKKGIVKKTNLDSYSNVRAGGIIAITLEDGDSLVNVLLTDGSKQIILATAEGNAVKFEETDARPIGRSGKGVIGIRLQGNDIVIGAVLAEENKTLLTITENGYGKRTEISEYRLINRGGSGVINIQCSERNGKVVAIKSIVDDDEIMLISKEGIVIRILSHDVSVIGRNTQGMRIMRLDEKDKVVSAAKIINDGNEVVV